MFGKSNLKQIKNQLLKMKKNLISSFNLLLFNVLFFVGLNTNAQQWIKEMPGYERHKEISPQIRSSVKSGRISVDWAEDGKSFEYNFDGSKYNFNIKKKKAELIGEGEKEESPMARYRRMMKGRPPRSQIP